MEVVESPDKGSVAASSVCLEFPATDGADFCSPPTIPQRLRRRLSRSKSTSPSSVEEIEAKLRDADIRRQKFYENLSNKAKLKPRSPSQSSSQEEDLGQRLEAKLQAAEKKRLNILAKAQIRLARLDELRHAAKTAAELQFKKERAELGTKVESRVQQAETNRMLILKASRQRRATMKERTSQSLLRRMARESKYKERVRAAICQKRAAAEEKRLGILEAERKRAHTRFLQVQNIVKSLSHQREIERRKMKDKLEDRLQRAKRQRAEYLLKRQRKKCSARGNWKRMYAQADLLSMKLARAWRQFLGRKKTTISLAKAYDGLGINERRAKLMPFDQLALIMESVSTLQTTKALLDRLELRYKLLRAVGTSEPSGWGDIDHLLKRVASPKKRSTPAKSAKIRDAKKVASICEAINGPVKLSRYQVRVVLCAYMILSHPEAVFNGQGEHEISLVKSAEKFVQEFELLIKLILDGPTLKSDKEFNSSSSRNLTFRSQLETFDAAWCSYLNCFVIWKVKDAQLLEEDLVRAACQMEISMIQTCKLSPEGEKSTLTHDMKAVQEQVTEDQKLLRDKVQHLSGDAGIQRMEYAITDTRSKYFETRERGSPIGSPITFSSSLSSMAPRPPVDRLESSEKSSSVVRSLFKDDDASFQPQELGSQASSLSEDSQFMYCGDKMEMGNEMIVNELIHEGDHTLAECFNASAENKNGIMGIIRETMEKAFWDSVTESVKEKHRYDQFVELMREVRDGLSEMSPSSWKKEIVDVIDLEFFSQLVNSNKVDMDYLGTILQFALSTLQKLSSPAKENDLKVAHKKFLEELHEICLQGSDELYDALLKGLRFVLEQIQVLKQEICKARIKLLEPILKGTAGLEYLNIAFSKHYGPPSDALNSLPVAKQWLKSVWENKDQEWNEYKNDLAKLTNHGTDPGHRLPSTPLRSGGSFSVNRSGSQLNPPTLITEIDDRYPECNGEKADLLLRLGLLKLVVDRIPGLTRDELPETMKLNLVRLRALQAEIQKIVVMVTSILVLRQTLLDEQLSKSPIDLDEMAKECVRRLGELLDSREGAGIEHIIGVVLKVADDYDKSLDATRSQTREGIMSRMLLKSLQEGDAVFASVSRVVHVAARGTLLGGCPYGRHMTEMALRKVGATALTDRVVQAASVLVKVAAVSLAVHGPWYAHLVDDDM